MADLANMVDYDGRISGTRLLAWLRGKEQLAVCRSANAVGRCDDMAYAACKAVEGFLKLMADDLERELTPPDYPEDDDEGAVGVDSQGRRVFRCKRCQGTVRYSEHTGSGQCDFCGCPEDQNDTVNLDDLPSGCRTQELP